MTKITTDRRESATPARAPEAPGHEGFGLGLALADAVPVALFSASAVVLAARVRQPLFVAGALLCALSGLGKVLWKLILAVRHADVGWLGRQLRYAMPTGFALMLVGAIASDVAWGEVLARVAAWPAWALLAGWLACMVAMGVLARTADQGDARANWVEQGVNALGQAFLLAAMLLA